MGTWQLSRWKISLFKNNVLRLKLHNKINHLKEALRGVPFIPQGEQPPPLSSSKCSHHSRVSLPSWSSFSRFPCPSDPGNQQPAFCLHELSILDVSCKWNHRTGALWCLVAFTQGNSLEVYPRCSANQYFILSCG